MQEPIHILVVDDEQAIRDVLTEGLNDTGYRCDTARDGSEALEKVKANGFQLVVSDIDMPQMDGVRLVQEIKKVRPDTEIIMLTGVVDVDVAVQAIRLGASDYLTKPFNLAEVRITVERALEKRRLVLENREYQRTLEARVLERTADLNRSYQTTLEALATALDTRDTETLGHSLRVAAYTVAVARRMGVSEPDLTDIYRGALLHDVGKIGVPDAILRKPGKLTPEEWVEMRKHPEIGYRILEGIHFLEAARQVVLCHQERFDGTGYPRGLKGQEIPLGARVFSVVDTLDAMTSDRCYRKALPYETARAEIIRYSGTQFDPDVVAVFLEIPPEEWTGIHQRVLAEVSSRGSARF
ncbi:MAG TPA: HD domain-containing phosphohydrolase [Candidatus Polarisedimenticolia bacterium]|nr:HD domain-containing phosphohydrolase [Candidatus Polarisedimenticolia bacterium]